MGKRMNRWFYYVISFIVLSVGVFANSKTIFATNADWYLDYSYILVPKSDGNDTNYIMIQKYTKVAESLYVPATATIDGITYYTQLSSVRDSIWYDTRDTLQSITFENGCKVLDGRFLFCGLSKLHTVNVEALDMSQATSTAWMFSGCESLTKLDVAAWDVSNVTNMFNMFGGCEKLASIDVSKWNTSNVTVMTSVFDHCRSLAEIHVENWDVSKVTLMDSMFYKCEKLETIDLHNWNTSNVTTMWEMFGRCYGLSSINVKGWDTSKVTSMAGMFCCDYNLTSLDLSSFDMSNVIFKEHDDQMFLRCGSLKKIQTPKKTNQKLNFNSGLKYVKKNGKKLGKKRYNCIPKTNESITLVCINERSKGTQFTTAKASGGKIKLKWKKVKTKGYAPVEYEVQCSTNKNFTDSVGEMTNTTDITFCVQDNVTEKANTTIKGLEKGKTYYVRVRVYTYEKRLSKWSKVKKIKVK